MLPDPAIHAPTDSRATIQPASKGRGVGEVPEPCVDEVRPIPRTAVGTRQEAQESAGDCMAGFARRAALGRDGTPRTGSA